MNKNLIFEYSQNDIINQEEYKKVVNLLENSEYKTGDINWLIVNDTTHIYKYTKDFAISFQKDNYILNNELENKLLKAGVAVVAETNGYHNVIIYLDELYWILYHQRILFNQIEISFDQYLKESAKSYTSRTEMYNYGNRIFNFVIPKKQNKISYRDTAEYKQWVKSVLNRDNNKCVCCGSELNIEAHHIKPYAKYKDLRTVISNGITLCECCHSHMILGGFHQIYGVRNNTKEQLQEYIDKKREALNLSKINIDDIVK